jgi:hypothetical protein
VTPETFAAGLAKLRAPAVWEIKAAGFGNVFHVKFERAMTDAERARLRSAGFVWLDHSVELNFVMMRWQKPTQETRNE